MKLRTASVLLILTAPLSAQVEFQAHEDRLSVLIAGKPFAGESTDHPHHRGLSFSQADVNGFNVWAGDPSQHDAKTGAIRLNRVERLAGAADFGSAEVVFDWLDPRGKAVLSEDRTMVFYGGLVDRMIDFDISLRTIDKAVFGDTKEGTFPIRVASGPQEPTGIDYAGEVDGEEPGIAIFDDRGNPHHSSRWHARGYGLFDRVLIHPGRTDPAKLTQAYAAYVKGCR